MVFYRNKSVLISMPRILSFLYGLYGLNPTKFHFKICANNIPRFLSNFQLYDLSNSYHMDCIKFIYTPALIDKNFLGCIPPNLLGICTNPPCYSFSFPFISSSQSLLESMPLSLSQVSFISH